MTILIILVTTLLVLDCLLLGLLIMIQLPKKEAGAGMAFGGGAADALFGAGSGTALSNLTKYTATAFFVLVFVLSILNNRSHAGNGSALGKAMEKINATSTQPAMPTPPNNNNSSAGSVPSLPLTISSNNIAAPTNSILSSNAPATSAPAPATTTSNNAAKPK